MARIFAYIAHKDGVVDDSAFELAAAARKIDPRCFADSHSRRLGHRSRRRVQYSRRFLR